MPSSTKEWCLLCLDSEILEQTSSTPSLGILSFYLQKTVGPSLVRNHPCSTSINSVPIHWQFSQYCYHRRLIFSLNTQSPPLVCSYYWPSRPFLPLLNKYKIYKYKYLRPNMVFFGHFVPSRSVNTYIHTKGKCSTRLISGAKFRVQDDAANKCAFFDGSGCFVWVSGSGQQHWYAVGCRAWNRFYLRAVTLAAKGLLDGHWTLE